MQNVNAEDAAGLADTLERALAEMPLEDNEVEPVSLTNHSSQQFELTRKAESRWRILNGSEKLQDRIDGIVFVDGERIAA